MTRVGTQTEADGRGYRPPSESEARPVSGRARESAEGTQENLRALSALRGKIQLMKGNWVAPELVSGSGEHKKI